jgi:signal recognition particle receptor subunit beta
MFMDAAELLYEILSNLTVLSERTPVLVACNKQDLQFARKATMVESDLEKEMEKLRKVKKAIQDESTKMGYLESLKKNFSFGDIQVPVQFCECSITTEKMEEVYRFVNN